MNKLQLTHALKILQLNLLLLKGFQDGYCFCNKKGMKIVHYMSDYPEMFTLI